MTREKAKVCIDAIIGTWEKCQNQKYLSAVDVEIDVEDIVALKMAIKALSQEQQSEWEHDHEILKAYADGQESMNSYMRNIEEIAEVMKCDADADTKCRMISNILNAKPHYFKSQEPCEDAISRTAALNTLDTMDKALDENRTVEEYKELLRECYEQLPPVSVAEKVGRCKDCKYFEYDNVAKVDGIPLIVAHEFCSRWGRGCMTIENGYCFLYEPQESEK